jgi:acyl-CoA reductase-like NAD-dependent aldehyde dehydrogenase
LNVVTGSGGVLGNAIVSHPGIQMISLTGSTAVGRRVAEICGRDLRRCALELGGKNAVIVMDDANLDQAIAAITLSAFGTSGQRCTATSRVIVHQAILSAFTDRLLARIEQLRIGDGLDELVDVGPLVNTARAKAVHAYTEIGKQGGALLLVGGMPLTEGMYNKGVFYKPTVFTSVKPSMRIAREEIFGPFLSILPVSSYEEAIQIANSTEYGLSTAIFTENMRLVFRAMRDIESGLVYINAGTIRSDIHLPFGGMKASGNGHRELGHVAVEEFSEVKSICVSYPPIA